MQTAHDRKRLFRRLLRQSGGVSADGMGKEFKKLLAALGIVNGATFYTLRGSMTTAMKAANLPQVFFGAGLQRPGAGESLRSACRPMSHKSLVHRLLHF